MKLYVGTYAKYNAGSIAGAWLDLDKFKSYEDFMKACRKLHKNERDPEFMFQDCELDPDCDWQRGLYSESAAPKEYWDLKKQYAKEAEEDAKKPVSADVKADRAEQKRIRAAYREALKNEGIWADDHMLDYCTKSPARIVELADGSFVTIEKPSIETRFCYGEDDRGQGGDGPGTMAYAQKQCAYARSEKGFMSLNLEAYVEGIVKLVGRKSLRRMFRLNGDSKSTKCVFLAPNYWKSKAGTKIFTIDTRDCNYSHNRTEGSRDFTADDIKRIRHAYMLVIADYRKRLRTWWKRNGAEKIHAWTYWTEA